MNIYFIGIGGKAMGPLAEFAEDAGAKVFGSDISRDLMIDELVERGIAVNVGEQDGVFLEKTFNEQGIDWLVHSSAIKDDHPELAKARELGIKTSKRAKLINHFVKEYDLEMIAVAGTHGKTTTTAMISWAFQSLGISVSHLIGAPIDFAPSGKFVKDSNIFIYEADEYDRNFLEFSPTVSTITTMDYDHADIYPSRENYIEAFKQFCDQSGKVFTWLPIAKKLGLENNEKMVALDATSPEINLPGLHNRQNATLAFEILKRGLEEPDFKIAIALNKYPGSKQRFEKLAENLYSDYAHTPEEIVATLQMVSEVAKPNQKIIAIYSGLTNARQHEIVANNGFHNIFDDVSKLYWLPTFLARENPDQKVLAPEEMIETLSGSAKAKTESAEINDEFLNGIKQHLINSDLVIFLGPDDMWLREFVKNQ